MIDLQTVSPPVFDAAYVEAMWQEQKAEHEFRGAQKMLQQAKEAPEYMRSYHKPVEQLRARVNEAGAAYHQAQDFRKEFEQAFEDRGGWSRAWLVLNVGGHVHKSLRCSTCFVSTQFGWLPQAAGMDEAEIVDLAGADACTVCWPSAPVESLSRPRRILHQTEVEAQAKRDEREAKRQAAADKKAAKAIGPLVDPRGYGKIETIAAAKGFLTDAEQDLRWMVEWASRDGGRAHPYYIGESVAPIADALAARLGTSVAQQFEEAAKRAAKRK
jgi:hypothetical protein